MTEYVVCPLCNRKIPFEGSVTFKISNNKVYSADSIEFTLCEMHATRLKEEMYEYLEWENLEEEEELR